jgi:general secretion pathway protein G
MGELPSTSEGLTALLKAPAAKSEKWKGPYLELSQTDKIIADPWNQPFVYRQPGSHNPYGHDLFSKGPDKTADTVDDIGNW